MSPVADITTLFRPQFWPFFVLHADYAYAMYWQAKGLILTGGIFTFLLWVTGSSGWAFSGALWYFFSAFTQWCYSWPSAIPEMVGLICLGTVFFCYLTVGRKGWKLAVAALGTVVCGIDFVLCAYLPHMIPLFWVALAMTVAWCVASRKEIARRQGLPVRICALLIIIAALLGFGWRIYNELRPAILAIAQTPYPGQRVMPGGGLPISWFGAHFLQWTETPNHFPSALANICEGSGFLWLAPVTLLCLPRLSLSTFQKAALLALWASFLLLFCWGVLPLPVAFGHLFGLDRVPFGRMLPALGLANISIVAVSAARFRRPATNPKPDMAKKFVYWLAGFLIFWVLLSNVNGNLGDYFGFAEIFLPSAFLAFLCVLIITGSGRVLALSLVISQAAVFGLVNPVERGLPVYTKSELSRFVQAHRDLLEGKWIVYSETPISNGFFASAGCFVYTGLRYVPDIDDFALFKSHGLDVAVINSLAYLDAQAIPAGQKSQFTLKRRGIVDWKVSASDPILGELGIRYVAFDSKPAAELTIGLQPIVDRPLDGFWIYRTVGKI